MRITSLLIFIICFNLANGLLAATGVYTFAPTLYDGKLIDTINTTVYNSTYTGSAVQQAANVQGFGDFITGIWIFTTIFFTGVFIPYQIFVAFGINTTVALLFSIPIYLIYGIGIVQFISGRYLE